MIAICRCCPNVTVLKDYRPELENSPNRRDRRTGLRQTWRGANGPIKALGRRRQLRAVAAHALGRAAGTRTQRGRGSPRQGLARQLRR